MMMRGLKELSSLPSIIEYRTTVIKDLLADLDAMEQIVNDYSRGKATLIESRNVIPAVRGGCADVYSCRLSAKENVELMVERTKKRAIAAGKKYGCIPKSIKFHHVKEEPGSLDAQIESYSLLGCGGGMSTFAVLYNGLLVPCQLMDQFSVDLNEYKFSEGWQQLPWKIETPELCEKCSSCQDISYCHACPASRYAETGNMGGCSEYYCEDVSEQKKYLMQTIPLEY